MANKQSESAGSPGGSGPGLYGSDEQPDAGSEPGGRSGREDQIELPEHGGVIIDYIPPRGGLRAEVGDIGDIADEG